MKKLLLISFLLLFSNFVASCLEDDTRSEISNSKKYNKETISFKEFLITEKNNKEAYEINKFTAKKYSNDSIDWELDTTKVVKIIDNDITTYTFYVKEKSIIVGFRNIIVKIEKNKTTNYIVHYTDGVDFKNYSSRKAIVNKLNSNIFNRSIECYQVVYFPVSGCSSGTCEWGWGLKLVDCNSNENNSPGGDGDNNTDNGNTFIPDGLPTDPLDGNGGGSGSGHTYSVNTQRLATHIYFSEYEKQWLTQNPTLTDIFLQLLTLNNYSSEYKSQIKWVTSYLSNNTSATNYFNQNPKDLIALFNFQKYGDEFLNIWINDFLTNVNEYSLNNEFYNFQFDYRSQMSQQELNIFNSLSPQTQFKYLKNAYFALNKAQDLYANSIHNGKGDAFRHAYFNALNVISIGKFYAEQLSTAHENKPSEYSYSFKENNMDLFNNKIGRDYGELKLLGNSTSVENLIKSALQRGELRYLTPLGDNRCPTCANQYSQLTPTNL